MTGLQLVSLAWRNLWRQRRRTLLTLVSIAFGGFLAVLMTALQDRSFADFIDTAARMGSGHVTLQSPEYQDAPSLIHAVAHSDELRSEALKDPRVAQAVGRISGQIMVSTASDSFGALFIGYDPTQETPETFEFADDLVDGALFTAPKQKGIVLGAVLARNLGAELGDKIVFTMTDHSGKMVQNVQRLTGTVATGAPSLDAALCLLPIQTVREAVGYADDETTQVAVFLKDGRNSQRVAAALRAKLGSGVGVLTWDDVQPEIRAFVAMKVGGGRVMEIIIAMLVAAGIFNTIFMSVMERTREFGIMIAIGYSQTQLFLLVILESAILAVLGLFSAIAVSAWPYYYMSTNGLDMSAAYAASGTIEISGVGFDPILRVGIFPENAVIIALVLMGATVLAGVYPAWRAGRVQPVEAINLV